MITRDDNTIIQTSPITVSLSDLQSSTPIPNETLLDAFGPSSLGILIVSGLPSHFPALRSRVLTKISHLAHLPQHKLERLVNEKAKYLVGWSHGKESLREGVVDWLKGSYYVNTAFDENDATVQKMRAEYTGFDEYLASNVWPDEDDEEAKDLQGFRQDVEELVGLIVDVAQYVARSIDRYAEENIENWPARTTNTNASDDSEHSIGYLEGVVSSSRTSKARLLHYFPSDQKSQTSDSRDVANADTNTDANDSWCTTHKDHGCLTGLTSAAFFDETEPSSTSTSNSKYVELPKSPSPKAGLYILDRTGQIHKVSIPKDCLAFQTGEALELVTKGKLKAVPHFVRGVDSDVDDLKSNDVNNPRRIARNTLAVFTQPNLYELVDLDENITFGEFARGVVGKNTT